MKSISIHKANVFGLGAIEFTKAILKEINNSNEIIIDRMYVNTKLNTLKNFYSNDDIKTIVTKYHFGIFSRVLEIFAWKYINNDTNDILVLGDLPLNTNSKQYILFHQALMFKKYSIFSYKFYKFSFFKFCFKLFLKKDDVVLVQSKIVFKQFKKYVSSKAKIKILDIKSEVYDWPSFKRNKRILNKNKKFNLVYPAAYYPHKNHKLLNKIKLSDNFNIILTIDPVIKINSNFVSLIGTQSRKEVYKIYKEIDALLFLSSDESLGMPLLEAIKCNLPIICPRTKYTQFLNKDNCFMFSLDNHQSLQDAIIDAKNRIENGWWPSWNFIKTFESFEAASIEEIILLN